MLVFEHHDKSEHAECVHAQEVRGSMGRLTQGSEASLGLDPTILIGAITVLQGTMAYLTTMVEKQSTLPNASVVRATVNTQPAPQAPPPPPPPRAGTVKELKLREFLKLKPLVFSREEGNEDPQWFLDRSEKACVALGCTSERKVELVSYQLQGKTNDWWKTWSGGRALYAIPVSQEEFKRAFMERFIPKSLRISRAREFEHLKWGSLLVDELIPNSSSCRGMLFIWYQMSERKS